LDAAWKRGHIFKAFLCVFHEASVLTAVISDIHANREALTAVLSHIRASGAERIVVLGDIVGYGADPEFCIDAVRQLEAAGAIVLKGNHDEAAAGLDNDMNATAQAAIAWTRDRLSTAEKTWLAGLPISSTEPGVLFVHANGWNPQGWGYIRTPQEAERSMRRTTERLTFCGHTHRPAVFHMSPNRPAALFVPVAGVTIPLIETRQWLVIAPAVGQPRDGNRSSGYVLYDSACREITFQRVPYDCETASRKILAAGLPPSLAERLLKGQ
jgi:diadenosine tetraphosphatase ApaH/serine/threonine PP2A family protein phosphatase